jgi:hypothetical protein
MSLGLDGNDANRHLLDGTVVNEGEGGGGGDKVSIETNPSKTEKGAIKAFYDATTSTLEISIDGVDIV